jgi:hypothetical protein
VAFLSTTLLDPAARTRVAQRHRCPDPADFLPADSMRCLTLDAAPEVGLVLAWGGSEAALASLREYYSTAGQPQIAARLAAAGDFTSCP